jgi:hypothetical protein
MSGWQSTVAGMREPDLHTARAAYDAIAPVYADQFKDTLDDWTTERALLAALAEVIRRGPAGPYEYYGHRVTAAYRWWPDHGVSLLRSTGITGTARLMENPEPDDRRQFRVAFILARKAPADGAAG